MSDCAVSVIIATFRRFSSLETTLHTIRASRFRADRFELIVVDNAGDSQTRRICDKHEAQYILETTPGKNAALNAALCRARGRLFLFTDDDIEASQDWVNCMWAACGRWPEHHVFGGTIKPLWPHPCPAYLEHSQHLGVFFTILEPDLTEGPHEGFRPFGPSMGVRRDVFDSGWRFNVEIGPRHGESYVMGSETDLVRRLVEKGHVPVYVPAGAVYHRIRPEQMTIRWLSGRASRYGRSLAYAIPPQGRCLFGAPRWLYRDSVASVLGALKSLLAGRQTAAFDQAMKVAVNWGIAKQYRGGQ